MHGHQRTADMLSVEEARERILALVPVLEAEERPLLETMGQVLAHEIVAPFDVPPADNSAMDGYAVVAEDVGGHRMGAARGDALADLVDEGVEG